MSIFTVQRLATTDEIAAEMDRRGAVIERLEASLRHWRDECGKLHARIATLRERRLVPDAPTPEMIEAGAERIVREYAESDWEEAKDMAESLNPAQIWEAMLSASPCSVCGNQERGQGGYLTCQCPAPKADLAAILQAHEMEKKVLYEALERALSHFAVIGTDQAKCAAEEIEAVLK